jgi:hypothetical protein
MGTDIDIDPPIIAHWFPDDDRGSFGNIDCSGTPDFYEDPKKKNTFHDSDNNDDEDSKARPHRICQLNDIACNGGGHNGGGYDDEGKKKKKKNHSCTSDGGSKSDDDKGSIGEEDHG